jgi:hypothetical protein
MRFHTILLLAAISVASASTFAFERDVHFGLTKWLALNAGFTQQEADAFATGDQRVDSGDMQYMDLVAAYGCLFKNQESATQAQIHHYPSAATLPVLPPQRVVVPGSDAAKRLALEIAKATPTQAGYLLFRFAEGLHAVQDSWSHQGTTDVPSAFDATVACDATLAWSHPSARGGWNSHKADLTREWPADTLAMASATYDLLLKYPAIGNVKRSPKPWAEIQPLLDAFIRASTKSEKQKWFVAQGISDVSFLEGISLPDGATAFEKPWAGHKLPPLTTLQSTQHHTDPALLEFYSRFFTQWASTDDFDAMASTFGAMPAPRGAAGPRIPLAMDKAELSARLKVWRIRDHGRVIDIAHASKPLTAAQRGALASIAKAPHAIAHYTSPTEAYFPLEVKGPEASPLLGFVITSIAPSPGGNQRAVAMARFRHAPYDDLLVLAERIDAQWRITSLASIVDH